MTFEQNFTAEQKYLYHAALHDWRHDKINDRQMIDVMMYLGWRSRELALNHLKERSKLEYKLSQIYVHGVDSDGDIRS